VPNIKSAKKRMRTDKKRHERNVQAKSAMRTAVKAVNSAIAAGELEKAQQALPAALSAIAKTAKKKIIHRRAAARNISRLTVRLNKAQAAAASVETQA
jgi:small subunit ribosomal protein S20